MRVINIVKRHTTKIANWGQYFPGKTKKESRAKFKISLRLKFRRRLSPKEETAMSNIGVSPIRSNWHKSYRKKSIQIIVKNHKFMMIYFIIFMTNYTFGLSLFSDP